MSELLFAVTDVETTGGQPAGNSMTEIAVVLTDGVRELDRFHTLLQPSHPIPFHIEQLTGISNAMVADAPRFEEIAEELLSFFDESVFVAHNVGFDYSFIKAAFEHVGERFNRQKLCTVRLSRKLFPGLPTYSLGPLCKHLAIEHNQAHRALSDTLATVELFHQLCRQDHSGLIESQLRRHAPEQWLPPQLPPAVFEALPEKPGVYILEGAGGRPLYIGKSVNVKKRVRQHFGGKMQSSRRQEFLRDVTHIQCIETGNEWIAALLEDAQIRAHFPKHNKAQKKRTKRYTVTTYEDRKGYLRLAVTPVIPGTEHQFVFYSESAARDWLLKQAVKYEVSLDVCGLTTGGQLTYTPDESNRRVQRLLSVSVEPKEITLLIDSGRTEDEHGLIVLRDHRLFGYAYISKSVQITRSEEIIDHTTQLPESEVTSAVLHMAETSCNKIMRIALSD